jgi:hypothetical protein
MDDSEKKKLSESDICDLFISPATLEDLRSRNEFLARHGLTGIWFETKRYECIESILRLAQNELAYRDTQ